MNPSLENRPSFDRVRSSPSAVTPPGTTTYRDRFNAQAARPTLPSVELSGGRIKPWPGTCGFKSGCRTLTHTLDKSALMKSLQRKGFYR